GRGPGPPRVPRTFWYARPHSNQGVRGRPAPLLPPGQPAQSSQDQGRNPGRQRRAPPSHSVLPTVSDHCTPAIQGRTATSMPHSCTPPLLVTIKGGGGLPLALSGLWSAWSLRLLSSRGRAGTTEHS